MSRIPRATLLCATVGGLLLAAPAAAAATPVPLAGYPAAPPQPVADSHPPPYIDDDETLRLILSPQGQVARATDDILLRVRAAGDFALFLPGRVRSVSNLVGSEIPPGQQQGRVSFLGFLQGPHQLGAEADLDPAAVTPILPLKVSTAYRLNGRSVAAGAKAAAGEAEEDVRVDNLTGHAATFQAGGADPVVLASVLDALRQASDLYTPETELGAVLPVADALSLSGTIQPVQQPSFVPLTVLVDMRLGRDASLTDAGGATVTSDARGTLLRWTLHLPSAPGDGGSATVVARYHTSGWRLPAAEIKADSRPLPASVFAPQGAATWKEALGRRPVAPALVVLAQAGFDSLHRVAEPTLPVGRPGPGPEKIRYDFIVEAAAPPAATPPPVAPVRAQAWVVVLVAGLALFLGANLWWAWSRN